MAAKPKKSYPLRVSQDVMDAMQGWADDELRSINAQIEYVLRDALRRAGRLRPPEALRAVEEAPDGETANDEPFLVTRPSSEAEEGADDIFPVKRPPA